MSRGYYNTPGAPFLYTAPDSGGPGGLGMDCLQLRSPTAPGPFHYLINEHSKSLIALQELQHEVGALLEFRDLVIETFPNLKTKLAASSTPSTMTSHASNIPVAVRREWEPGIRVRRKLQHKDDTSYSRSRSNSHSSKQQPKSGDAVSVIQDSGFSTETSSSKETPSASSSALAASSSAPTQEIDEAEDELWNLLDVIHRKGTRLKDEVEALQGMLHEQNMEQEPNNFQRSLLHASVDDVRQLRRERDVLLDRVAEMEAEMLAGRVHTSRLQSDLESLLATKHDLEEQLRTVISQKSELNNRIHDMHLQFVSNKSPVVTPESPTKGSDLGKTINKQPSHKAVVKRSSSRSSVESLDSIMGNRIPKVREPDSKRIAAILLEHDPLILQRHLLSQTVQNQLLQQRLDMIIRSKNNITDKLDKAKEENDDLRFQLEDRNIELEGTRARVRLLEQLQLNKPIDQSPDIIPLGLESNLESRPPSRTEITTASMKNMSPLPINLQMDHSSSTESAQDQIEQNRKTDHRRRPSKIPLPGMKSYAAPKPPVSNKSPGTPGTRSRSGGSPGRPNSSQSWRNKSEGNSLSGSKSNNSLSGGNKSRNGSLTTKNNKDSLKTRDSLTGKLRGNDSLTKLKDNSFGNSFTSNKNSPSKRESSNKTPGTPVRRVGSSSSRGERDSPDMKILNNSPRHSPWLPISYNSDTDLCPDSLDAVRLPPQPYTIGTSSSGSQMFQTANTFFWNTSPTSEYFDSIDSTSINLNNCSMMDSSLYQENGEGLAECDSLENSVECHVKK